MLLALQPSIFQEFLDSYLTPHYKIITWFSREKYKSTAKIMKSTGKDYFQFKVHKKSEAICWLHFVTYGYKRFSKRGNGIVSRTCSVPEIQATVRSKPSPKPECGTEP